MVLVNANIGRAVGAWCALAIGLAGWSVVVGVRPSWTLTLLVVCAVPLGVLGMLVAGRAEARTAAQVLHAQGRGARHVRAV